MIRCRRCGVETPRLSVHQEHCPRCAAEVAAIIASDQRRRTPRFSVGKALMGGAPR